jgi:hypothetical protein
MLDRVSSHLRGRSCAVPILTLAALVAAAGCAKSEPVRAEAEEIKNAVTEANDVAANVQRNRSGS